MNLEKEVVSPVDCSIYSQLSLHSRILACARARTLVKELANQAKFCGSDERCTKHPSTLETKKKLNYRSSN